MEKRVTDGRDYLGTFAPTFAEINDDVLFGQVWSREHELSLRDRSMITIAGLMGAGILDQSLKGHLEKGRKNGITKGEIAEIITHLAFYTGWPKGWVAFSMAREVYENE
jgi:4-carboxymuconolactone decarboxylase